MNKKAERIELAMCNVPIEQRLAGGFRKAVGVYQAIASHRHSWKKGTEQDSEGTIIEKKAAKSFGQYKEAYQKLVNSRSTSAATTNSEPDSNLSHPRATK